LAATNPIRFALEKGSRQLAGIPMAYFLIILEYVDGKPIAFPKGDPYRVKPDTDS
jgi:hypothetical protein